MFCNRSVIIRKSSCVVAQVLQLSLNEEDSPSCLSHMLLMLKNVREGNRYVLGIRKLNIEKHLP